MAMLTDWEQLAWKKRNMDSRGSDPVTMYLPSPPLSELTKTNQYVKILIGGGKYNVGYCSHAANGHVAFESISGGEKFVRFQKGAF